MINPSLIEHIFKAASISRWNDYPKMVDINELDKQAHKVLIAYFLAKLEGDINMRVIVEYGVFEFLSRVVVTDIRPDVLHYIQKSKASELNSWIKTQLDKINSGVDIYNSTEDNEVKFNSNVEADIAREKLKDEFIASMTLRAMNSGNYDMLKAFLKNDNIRKNLIESGVFGNAE